MGVYRRILVAVAGSAAIVLGSAGVGYGVYDAWQQEQDQQNAGMVEPDRDRGDAGSSDRSRTPPSTEDRTSEPTPAPDGSGATRDRTATSSPDDSTPDSKPDERAEPDDSPDPEPTRDDQSTDNDDQQQGDPPGEPSPEVSAASSTSSQMEAEVVRLTNAERKKAGCEALRTDEALTTAARKHSTDMADQGYFDHESPDGTTPWKRMTEAGYKQPAAENIAKGQPDAESVVDAWMDSSGHRKNILNCDYEAIGVGVELDEGPYWTQTFGFN